MPGGAAGPANAPTIVFLHGTRLTGALWTAQQASLAAAGFRTIAPDLPGHGTRAREPFTLDGACDVVASTIRAEAGDGRAIVVGLSLGGYVAMAFAASEPDRVRGLVLTGATMEPIGLVALPYRGFANLIERAEGDRFDRLNAWFFQRRFAPDLADPIIAGGFWPRGGAMALRAIAGERFIPRLAAYPGRTLLINGELDLPFRLGAPAFAAAARDARRVRLAGASHLANLDRPAAFSHAVRQFAGSLGDD